MEIPSTKQMKYAMVP